MKAMRAVLFFSFLVWGFSIASSANATDNPISKVLFQVPISLPLG